MFKTFIPTLVGKLITITIHKLSLGSGSTWPGHVALFLNESYVKDVLTKHPDLKVILITGTNGKTTTSTLVKFLLERNGLKVFQNSEGANLLNGVASSLIRNLKNSGDYDVALFEVDENSLPEVVRQTNPHGLIILNLFRDQLDRYGEVNTIARKWLESLKKLPKNSTIFLNADDPQISYLGKNLRAKVLQFGLERELLEEKKIPHDVDSIYCPNCGNKLTYKGLSYSHLGDYMCVICGFRRKKFMTFNDKKFKSPLEGAYNFYNVTAAIFLANNLFKIPLTDLKKTLVSFKPAFGRQERGFYKGRKTFLILSKNPTGFNQSIKVVSQKLRTGRDNLLVVLNDRIPDGRDVSWIWDVEFESLPKPKMFFVSGDRAYEMALRLKYGGRNNLKVVKELTASIEEAIRQTEKNATLYIMPTYSGMLEVRKLIKGKKFL